MNEEAGPSAAFYLVVGSLVLVVLGVCGFLLHLNWGRLGLPDPAGFVEEVQEAHTGEVKGAVVVEGNAANYLNYVTREDVFVAVNFYQRWDQYHEDLKLDLKRLSARQDGQVVLMNVDAQRNPQICATLQAGPPPDVRLMHAGEQLGQFTGERLVWELEDVVESKKILLVDPIRQAAREVDPYAESLRKGDAEVVPKGVAPVR